ncbi:MAG: hypothetical protein ACI9FN_000533 [Saprospiraceae bacterium]|jgi:hypothetical protein
MGSVSIAYGVMLENAVVSLENLYTSKIAETKSDNTRFYIFPNIQAGRPYAVNALYDDSMNNGLTTRDVILIQHHLMGINSYESHWKMLQSDVNQDQRVSAIDIVELGKTRIGQASEKALFPTWRFFDAALTFNPLDYSNHVEIKDGVHIENMTTIKQKDLISIKLGDVDHSAILSQD